MDRPAPSNPSIGLWPLAAIALLLLVGGLWVTIQGGFAPVQGAAFLDVLYVLTIALCYIIPLWIAAAGLGWAIRLAIVPGARNALVLQLGTGLAALLLCDWALGWIGWLNGVTAWGLCGLGAIFLIHQAWQPRYRALLTSREIPSPPWPVVLACPALGIMLVACTCPPGTLWRVEALGYDVLSYHLQLPREWLALGRIQGVHHNVYSYLPNLVEAGYTAIGAMAGSIYDGIYAAQVFHTSAAVLAALAIGAWVWRALEAGEDDCPSPPGRGWRVLTPGEGGADQKTRNPAENCSADSRVAGGPRPHPAGRPATLSRRERGRLIAASFAGVMLLVLPWTMVTGTLAYDEMFALALGAAAMAAAFDPAIGQTLRGAAIAGFLAGAATLAKLPFGPMLALPVGLVYLTGLTRPSRETNHAPARHPLALAAVAALAGMLTLAPYLARNALWTGNPVFPFAAARLGSAYWGPAEVERWNLGHGLAGERRHRLWNLGRHWLFNTGYGAIGSLAHPAPPPDESRYNIAKFSQEWGFPLLWLTAAAGAALGLAGPNRKKLRRPTLALLMTLAVQLLFWVTLTHMQSRFLIPTLLPGCGLVGLLLGGLLDLGKTPWQERTIQIAASLAGVALAAVFTLNSYGVFSRQIIMDMRTHRSLEAWRISDSLLPIAELEKLPVDADMIGNHPINHLPIHSRTYLLADNADLLWIRRPMVYESAFDPCMLGQVMRQCRHDASAVTEALRTKGITNVWVNWSELRRLHETYGFDPDVTRASLTALASEGKWRVVQAEPGWFTLYALP